MLVAIFGLVVLKVAGLVLDGGYVFDYDPHSNKASWAQETINFPGGSNKLKGDPADITGSVQGKEEKKQEPPKQEAAAPPQPAKPDGVVVYPEQSAQISPSERAILERLQARRQELEQRAREVEIRESLLKAAERRIESKVEEVKIQRRQDRRRRRPEGGSRRRPLQGHHHHV